MNNEFKEILKRIDECKDLDDVSNKILLPAIVHLEKRLEKLEKLLLPTTFEDMENDIRRLNKRI